MAKPFQVDITADDKTAKGVKSAEKRFEGMQKPLEKLSKQAGKAGGREGPIGKLLETLSGVTGAGKNAAGGLGEAIEGTVGVARGAAVAGWALGGLVGAAVLAAAAGGKMGLEWIGAGAAIKRSAEGIGVTSGKLQMFRKVAEQSGVEAGAMDAALQGIGDTFNDARWGRNPQAQAMLAQLGIRLKTTKKGAVDVEAAIYDISDAIARQSSPQTQRLIAKAFGVEAALPLLRRGSKALRAEMAQASQGIMTDKQIDDAERMERKVVKTKQAWEDLKRSLVANFVIPWLDPLINGLQSAVNWMARLHWAKKGEKTVLQEAWDRLWGRDTPPRKAPSALPPVTVSTGFAAFAKRIEMKESRGKQFGQGGAVLASPKGALGVMQMLPSTAEATAKLHGVAWDPQRFRTDPAYNRYLGQLHLQDLLKRYNGSEVLAAAAYNAGVGRLEGYWEKGPKGRRYWRSGWLQRYGDPRKGEISESAFAARIPFDETRDYVAATAGVGGLQSRAQVDINLRGAPAGTTVASKGDRGVPVTVKVEKAMPDLGN